MYAKHLLETVELGPDASPLQFDCSRQKRSTPRHKCPYAPKRTLSTKVGKPACLAWTKTRKKLGNGSNQMIAPLSTTAKHDGEAVCIGLKSKSPFTSKTWQRIKGKLMTGMGQVRSPLCAWRPRYTFYIIRFDRLRGHRAKVKGEADPVLTVLYRRVNVNV